MSLDDPESLVTALQTEQTILIVDDAPSNIKMLAAILSDMNCKILFSTSGENALEQAVEHHPDIILLDVMMPGMNGHEVCRELKSKAQTSNIPVIFITALDEQDDEEVGLNLGAIDYIAKPFSAAIVKARVKNHLALRYTTKALEHANIELERLATTDPLTGAYNRRHFMAEMEREAQRHNRYENSLSVLMLDIDHFKSVNDTYGHASGDAALIAVVDCLSASLRETDILGRLGGEEFAVILPDTPASHAFALADRLRLKIADLIIPQEESGTFTITTSIGLAETITTPIEQAEDLLGYADKALYYAKTNGRNQVQDYAKIPED